MKTIIQNIQKGQEVRKNLIEAKVLLKDEKKKPMYLAELKEVEEMLLSLLESEDAKVRKNVVQILGELKEPAYGEKIWLAYEREMKEFVKSSYIAALGKCEAEDLLPQLKLKLEALLNTEVSVENEKHHREEVGALREVIGRYEKRKRHIFVGMDVPCDVILLTEKAYKKITADQITVGKTSLLGAGVRVEQGDLEEILKIRTFKELFFTLNTGKDIKKEELATTLMKSSFVPMTKKLHEGDGPFYFRIECKSSMNLKERSDFTKKLAVAIEKATDGLFVNSTSDYELELRLIETREGGFYPLIKYYTLKDRRFAYRREVLATSIAPERAALIAELATPYLKEDGQVLDPFCGVGTMLIERNYRVHADTMYGIDFYEKAIAGAKENTAVTGMPIHFVQRDSLTFTHEYLFDEIITNFPTKSRTKGAHEIEFMYEKFFEKAVEWLKDDGKIILYSKDKGFVKKALREYKEFGMIKDWCISEKEEAHLFIIERVN